MSKDNLDHASGPRCVQQLFHGDLVVLEAVQTSTVYAVETGDPQGGSPALLVLSGTPANRAVERRACLEVVEQGEWLGLRSLLLEGLFLQARKKSPHLVFFSPRLGVWEQWKAEAMFQGVLQQHSPALCLTSRQVPAITLSVRAWKIGSVSQSIPPHITAAYPQPELDTSQGFSPRKWTEGPAPADGEADVMRTASVTSSLQDDALELSHNVVKGYVVRVLKWPLYLAFRVWRAEARAGRLRRAEVTAHHERWLQSTAWAAMQQRAAMERHDRHMIVLACQCWAKQRVRRVARALQAWHARAYRAAWLKRLCLLIQQKRRRTCAAAVLGAWNRHALEQRALLVQCNNVRLRLEEKQARAVLHCWRDSASKQRRSLNAFQERRRTRLLRCILVNWNSVASRRVAARQAVHASVTAATTTALLAIFQAWCAVCNRRRQLAARAQLVADLVARHSLGASWCAWRGSVEDAASRRRRVDLLQVIRQQHLAGRVLRRWMVLARGTATLRFAADQLALRSERRLLPRAFAAWCTAAGLGCNGQLEGSGAEAVVARIMVVLRRRLAADRRCAIVRGVLTAWRQLSSPRSPARFAALAFIRMRRHAQARAVLTQWRGCVQLSKELHLEVMRRRRAAVLHSSLWAWAGHAAYCRRLGRAAAAAARRSSIYRLRSCFGGWRRQTCHGQQLWDRAMQAHGCFLKRRVMAAWKRRCRIVRAALGGLAHCRKEYEEELLRAALQALHALTLGRRRVQSFQQERVRVLARHALRAWWTRAVYGMRLRAFGSRMQSNLRRCMARGVLRSWFLASHAAVLQLHVLQAMRAASLAGTWRVEHGGTVSVPAMPLNAAASSASVSTAHCQRNPPHPLAAPLSPPVSQPALLRLLVVSLGGSSVTGCRGGASATLEVAELLRTRLPAIARLAARARQQALAVLGAWRLAVADGSRLRVTAGRLQRRCRLLALRGCFHGWAAAMADVRGRRSTAMSMARRAVLGLMARCLAVWRQQVRYSVRLKRTCLMLLGRRTTRLRRAALMAWHGEVRAAQARVQEARKLKGDARMALLQRSVRAWRVGVEDAQEVRTLVEKRYVAAWNRAKRQVLQSWRQVAVLQQQHLATCMRVLQARAARRLMSLVIKAWSSFSRSERQRREDWPRLCRVFYAWRTLVQPAGRAAAAAEAKLAELELAELESSRNLRRGVAQDAGEEATVPAAPVAPPAGTNANTSATGPQPSSAAKGADSTTTDAQQPPSPPPEELYLPHSQGAGPHDDQSQQGMFSSPAGPGALTPASYLWHQWYHMMHAGGLGALSGGPIPLSLAPGSWAAMPGAAVSSAAQAENAAEAAVLRGRLEKLEAAMKQQQCARESEDQESSKGSVAQTAAATSSPTIRPPPLPPAPAQVSSSRIMTASSRPEPGPLYQIRQQLQQQVTSTSALGDNSSSSITNLAAAESQGVTAASSLVTAPPAVQREGLGAGGCADAGGTSVLPAALSPQALGAADTSIAPADAPAPVQPGGVQGTLNMTQTASCRPQPGPLYQVRAGSNTVIGCASISSLSGPEGLGSVSDSVISSVASADVVAPVQPAPAPAPQPSSVADSLSTTVGVFAGPGPATPQAAAVDTPSPSSPSRTAAQAQSNSYRTLTASCRPEPRPQCQVNRATSSLAGLDPTDSVKSGTVGITAAATQPSQAAGSVQLHSVQADGVDHFNAGPADNAVEGTTVEVSSFTRSPPSAAARLDVREVDVVIGSSMAKSGADGNTSTVSAAVGVATAARPSPPPPAPARIVTTSCLPEPGPLYQKRQGTASTDGRASSRSLLVLEVTDLLANSNASGSTSPHAAASPQPQAAAQPQMQRVVVHSYAPPPAPAFHETPHSGSATTADGSSSLGSPTSLQAWSRRTTADLSVSEEGEQRSEARRQSMDVLLDSTCPSAVAEAAKCSGRQSHDWEQRRRQAGTGRADATQDVLAAAAHRLSIRHEVSGEEALQRQSQSHVQMELQLQASEGVAVVANSDSCKGGAESAAMPAADARPACGRIVSLPRGAANQVQQPQKQQLGQQHVTPAAGQQEQEAGLQYPQQLLGSAVDSNSLVASLASAGTVMLPGGQIAQLVLPPQGVLLQQGPRPGMAPSILQQQPGLSQPPLEQSLFVIPPSTSAQTVQFVQAGTPQTRQGVAGVTASHGIQQLSGAPSSVQVTSHGAAPAVGSHLGPPRVAASTVTTSAQPGSGIPYAMQHGVFSLSAGQAQAAASWTWQPSSAQQGCQAATCPGLLGGSEGVQGVRMRRSDLGLQVGRPLAGGEVRTTPSAVLAVMVDPAHSAPNMSELEAMLGELEARSRTAMSSPRRLQQALAGSDMAVPMPPLLLGARRATAVLDSSTMGGGRLECGGGGVSPPLLGLQGLDGIDALHIRATTLSAPGAAIFTSPTDGANTVERSMQASGLARPVATATQTSSAHAPSRPPAAEGAEEGTADPVDAALRRLEAASIHAHVAAAAWSAATSEVAAAAASGPEGAPGDREMARLAAAVEAAAAVATAFATEQPGRGQLGPTRENTGAGAAAATAINAAARERSHATWSPIWAPGGTGAARAAGQPQAGGNAADLLATFLPCAEQLLIQRHSISEHRSQHQQPRQGDGSQGPRTVAQEAHLITHGAPQGPPSAQPGSIDLDGEGLVDGMCPTCGSPTRQGRSPSPPWQGSAPPQPAVKDGRHGAARTGQSTQHQHLQSPCVGRDKDQPSGREAAWRCAGHVGAGGGRPSGSAGGSAGSSAGGAHTIPGFIASPAAHCTKSNWKQAPPMQTGGIAAPDQQPGKRQADIQQEDRNQQQQLQLIAQQQLQQQRISGAVDPVQEVAELAKRRGNHHLAVTLAGLVGTALPHGMLDARPCGMPDALPRMTADAVGRPAAVQGVATTAQPSRVKQTAPDCSGARLDARACRPRPEVSARSTPTIGPTTTASAPLPLPSVRSVDSTVSNSSSMSGPIGSSSGSSCTTTTDGFDADPLHLPLRRMLGECRRLQSTAAWREEQGDAVVREVVADLSPRQAVATALAVMYQGRQSPEGSLAIGLGGRRFLVPAGRRS